MEDFTPLYIQKRPEYESLLEAVRGIIESLLRRESIRYYHVQARVKEFDSFHSNLSEKKYAQPEDMIDFAGLSYLLFKTRQEDWL